MGRKADASPTPAARRCAQHRASDEQPRLIGAPPCLVDSCATVLAPALQRNAERTALALVVWRTTPPAPCARCTEGKASSPW